MAHSGIAVPAVVVALAFAVFGLATAIAEIAVFVLNQHVGDDAFNALELEILGTDLPFDGLVRSLLALLLVFLALFAAWRLGRATWQMCPACLSEIPLHATVCRYCTTEVPGAG
jgi:ribosomal protein L40E